MCSRVGFFSQQQFLENLQNAIDNFNPNIEFTPSYNIAPSQSISAVLNNKTFVKTHFGLIPHWAKDKSKMQINARSETIREKPMFKDSVKFKRCLIPANGFYEWKHEAGNKIPYWIHPTIDDYFAFAGIYDEWNDYENNQIITSSAIITTEPNKMMQDIHNRMPLILKKEDWRLWLDEDIDDVDSIKHLFRAFDEDLMDAYSVSSSVGSPAYDSVKCIERAASQATLF